MCEQLIEKNRQIIKDIKDKRKGWWADYFYDIKTDSVRRLK